MTTLRSEAFVLSRTPLTESSWIVSLLTRQEGKVRAVARGARRTKSPFRGALEPLNRVWLDVGLREGRDLGTLTSADLEESAFDLFSCWPAAGILLAVVEVLDRGLADHSAEEETFRLVDSVLKGLRAGASPDLAWIYFAAWFLRLHGVLGRPNRCAGCGASHALDHFDVGAGGWLCASCKGRRPEQGLQVPAEARAVLGRVFAAALPDLVADQLCPNALKTLKSMLYLTLIAYLGRPLASGGQVIG
jgi:DNA repair protein RecO (recombination protein O)